MLPVWKSAKSQDCCFYLQLSNRVRGSSRPIRPNLTRVFCRWPQLSGGACDQTMCASDRATPLQCVRIVSVKGFFVVVANLCVFWRLTFGVPSSATFVC